MMTIPSRMDFQDSFGVHRVRNLSTSDHSLRRCFCPLGPQSLAHSVCR
jgi:hypothetical protein